MKPRSTRARAPIALQLMALMVASLLAAQAITLGIVLLLPPPRPAMHRLSEIAEALRGGRLETRFGRPLLRETSSTPPAQPSTPREWDARTQRELAMLLQVPPSRVVLVHHRAAWPRMMFVGRRLGPGGPGGPPGDFRELREYRRVVVMRGALFGDPGGPPPPGGFGRLEPTLFDDFTAAVQQASGQWVVVRPAPEWFLNAWQRRVSLWLVASMAVVAPAGYLFARRITAPLGRFAQAAETLGRDPQAPLMNLSGPAEVGMAARAFNEMQARIKRYVEDRTAMVGAISHDLRTPLARIRFKMEAAPADLKRSVIADVAQMEQMIAGVLAFIRDASEPRSREPLDLLSLVECVVDDAALVGGDVQIVEEQPLAVVGDPVALQRMFANLIDNALKYGVRARVRVRREAEMARVEIEDQGPGLPVGELERVFEPFYRSDRARNLDQGGVGLGLAVARSTARAHGGDVELRTRADGLTVLVTLPIPSAG